MVKVYGLAGYEPYEVAKMYLKRKRVPFECVDIRYHEAMCKRLLKQVKALDEGVILDDGKVIKVIPGISMGSLERWFRAYRERLHSDDDD